MTRSRSLARGRVSDGSDIDDPTAVRLHYVSLLLGAAVLLWLGRDHWFFADEWEFIVNRGVTGNPELGLFVPHTQHWSTGPILVWRALLAVFGLHTYLPFLVMNVLVHLSVVHLVWRLAGRAGVGAWTRTSLAALFMVAASNGDNAFWAFQISFNGTVAIGLLMLLLAEPSLAMSTRRQAGIAGLGLVMVTFSAIAVPLLVAVALLIVIRHGWRRAVVCVGPAVAAFALWYAVIGREPIPGGNGDGGAHVELSTALIGPSARFVGEGMASALGGPLMLGGAVSVAVLVGLAAWCALHRRDLLAGAAGASCAALAAVVFFLIAAIGRSMSDADDPTQTRYLYVAGALLMPLLMVCADSLVRPLLRRSRLFGPALLVAVAVLGVANLAELRQIAQGQSELQKTLGGRVLSAATQVRSGEPYVDSVAPEPQSNFDLQMDDLVRLIDQGWVPEVDPVDEPELGIVRIQSQVGLSSEPVFDDPGTAVVADHTGVDVEQDAEGCLTIVPTAADASLTLRVVTPTSLRIDSPGGTTFHLALATADGDPLPASRGIATPAGTSWLNLATTGHLLVVTPDPPGLTLCGLRSD